MTLRTPADHQPAYNEPYLGHQVRSSSEIGVIVSPRAQNSAAAEQDSHSKVCNWGELPGESFAVVEVAARRTICCQSRKLNARFASVA